MTKLCLSLASVSLCLSAICFSKEQYSWQQTPQPLSSNCNSVVCNYENKAQSYTFEKLDEDGWVWLEPAEEKIATEDFSRREYEDEPERNPFFTKMEQRARSSQNFKHSPELKLKWLRE